ncbi:MAG: hypothetical protein UV97_C0010G0023 [Candidatus Yanofskybacteria bacterium GW2011_GWF2_43_596]|nr:MAG: hypothetical protein UV97_C0010G0023 [Candidatus Yanofskybacteria bacterium GW2011_GWF2_43_596]
MKLILPIPRYCGIVRYLSLGGTIVTRSSQGIYMVQFLKSFLVWDIVRRDAVDIPAIFAGWYLLLKLVGGSISSFSILFFVFVAIPFIHFVNFNIRHVSADDIDTGPDK